MNASATTSAPVETQADTIVVGVFDGKNVAHDIDDGALQALLESGEAKRSFKHFALTHAAGKRWLVVGSRQARGFRRRAGPRARRRWSPIERPSSGPGRSAGSSPTTSATTFAGALVEGTALATYRFDQYKSVPEREEDRPPPPLAELIVSAHHEIADQVGRALVIAEAVNAARTLQNSPSNEHDADPAGRTRDRVGG